MIIILTFRCQIGNNKIYYRYDVQTKAFILKNRVQNYFKFYSKIHTPLTIKISICTKTLFLITFYYRYVKEIRDFNVELFSMKEAFAEMKQVNKHISHPRIFLLNLVKFSYNIQFYTNIDRNGFYFDYFQRLASDNILLTNENKLFESSQPDIIKLNVNDTFENTILLNSSIPFSMSVTLISDETVITLVDNVSGNVIVIEYSFISRSLYQSSVWEINSNVWSGCIFNSQFNYEMFVLPCFLSRL